MKNIFITIYDLVDTLVAFILGYWFIIKRGKLKGRDKPILNLPPKWFYVAGYIAIIYGIWQTIRIVFSYLSS